MPAERGDTRLLFRLAEGEKWIIKGEGRHKVVQLLKSCAKLNADGTQRVRRHLWMEMGKQHFRLGPV